MLVDRAEERFQKGMQLLAKGRAREALAFFSTAIEIEKQMGKFDRGQARYLSYHGLCLCLTRSGTQEALRCCRMAADMEDYHPEIWWNLGRVAFVAGRRGEAHQALQRGLRIQRGHPGIVRDLRRMGIRRRPVLPFLARQHPINILLGRVRCSA